MLRSVLGVSSRAALSRNMATKATKTYQFEDIKSLVLKPDARRLLVDVREPSEVQQYALPTAINLPLKSAPGALGLSSEEFEDVFGIPKPATENELIFFCAAGVRAKAAEELANSYGYGNTGLYPGSIHEWLEKGGDKLK
ncbi:LANO_0H17370g1_1 [Lachancea nothofagi CBS 11611]|uniref:LANO_0H17370g1_1 n=1 Tax=Lachancea nothofagi CBS 11611 TaxID=1266666 RepID=A0A1G4KN87_9SACH|nr:LANO_0H17370g1_1 [Lachancea nothofagi CBS 11611]